MKRDLLNMKSDKRKTMQIYQINLLKPWRDREGLFITSDPSEPELGPQTSTFLDPDSIRMGAQLPSTAKGQVRNLLNAFPMVIHTSQDELISFNIMSR